MAAASVEAPRQAFRASFSGTRPLAARWAPAYPRDGRFAITGSAIVIGRAGRSSWNVRGRLHHDQITPFLVRLPPMW
jgi:hypothetical protein